MSDLHEANRQSWNEATKQHRSHKPDLIQQYLNGHNNLHIEDVWLLRDVAGKRVAHLQCNDGQDSVSIAKFLGAKVTGIDISDTAIDFARELNDAMQLDVDFVRSDIFDWFDSNIEPFDYVFTSYGTIVWISSINDWAAGIAKTLKPGGKLIIIDFHPLIGMFEIDWSLVYDYMGGKTLPSSGVGDYVGDDWQGEFQNPKPAYEFAWGIGNLLSAVLANGLQIEAFKEYPYMNGWQRMPDLKGEPATRRFYAPDNKPLLPMMFSLVATKPA